MKSLADYNKLLKQVNEVESFKLPDGSQIRSLPELVERLGSMDDEHFSHHLSEKGNDFANWIKHCFDDELLSKRISQIITKKGLIEEINTRIEQVKTLQSQSGTGPNIQPTVKPIESVVTPSTEIMSSEPLSSGLDDDLSIDKTNDTQNNNIQNNDLDADLNLDADLDLDSDLGIEDEVDTNLDQTKNNDGIDEIVENPTQHIPDQPNIDSDLDLDTDLDTDLDIGNASDVGINASNNENLESSHDQSTNIPESQPNSEVPQSGNNLDGSLSIDEDTTGEVNDEILSQPSQPVEEPIQAPTTTLPEPPPIQPEQPSVPYDEKQISEEIKEDTKLTPEEEKLLNTDNKELSPSDIFKKLKLQKKVGQVSKETKPVDVSKPVVQDHIGGSEIIQPSSSGSISLTPEEEKLLNTDNKELSPREIFKKLQLKKKIGDKKIESTQSKEVSETVPDLGSTPNLEQPMLGMEGLSDEEKRLLNTENKELNPREIFKKLQLKKKLEKEGVKPVGQTKEEVITGEKILNAEEKLQVSQVKQESDEEKPVDLLNISDDEFSELIGLDNSEEYVAMISTEDMIKVPTRKRLKTGVQGFDEIIDKGILEGSAVLVSGGPGSGKTTFCIQQLGWAAERGEKCLFISLEEKEERLIEHMKGYGLNPEKYLKNGTLKVKKLDSFKLSRNVEALLAHARGELMIDIDPIMDIIPEGFVPDRIVLDSLSSIAAAFGGQPEVYRIYVEQLFSIFEKLGTTSFIITEIHGSEQMGHGGVEDFIADGVINFYNIKRGQVRQPAVEILKMRGCKHRKGVVPFSFIPGKGIEVYPLERVFYDEK